MGLLNFQISGNTTALPKVAPPAGYAWRVKWIHIQLSTGTVAGTRSLGAYAMSSQLGVGYAELCNTNSQTGTSTNYSSSFSGQVSTSVTPDVDNEVWNSQEIVIDNINTLELLSQAISGDEFYFQFVVEEFIP